MAARRRARRRSSSSRRRSRGAARRTSSSRSRRARAAELLRVGQWFKRLPSDFPIPFELWETIVIGQAVGRDYQPPPEEVD